MKYNLIKPRMTPSGLWDNGLWGISGEMMDIPDKVMESAIVEDFKADGVDLPCQKITAYNRTWTVVKGISVGRRIELKRDIERYPQFIAKKGERGTIVEIDEEKVSAKMDNKLDGAEEWDNCLQWYKSDDSIKDVSEDIKITEV
jgi:hypothetical protein